jgi:DNA-directed RNA polymerase specialized sigma subunit
MKEKIIENHLRYFSTYKIAVKNLRKQLDYISPTLTAKYGSDNLGSFFYIANDTEKVAIDRIESKRALDLHEEINTYQIIIESIENALEELNDQEKLFVELRYFKCLPISEITKALQYQEEKSTYRIRRYTLDKLLISLSNLLVMK